MRLPIFGGDGGIWTHVPLITATRFPIVLVMTTSIHLRNGSNEPTWTLYQFFAIKSSLFLTFTHIFEMNFKVYVKIPAVLTASQISELKKPTFERAAQAEERKRTAWHSREF